MFDPAISGLLLADDAERASGQRLAERPSAVRVSAESKVRTRPRDGLRQQGAWAAYMAGSTVSFVGEAAEVQRSESLRARVACAAAIATD